MSISHFMGAVSAIRPRGLWPPNYDLLTWLRLGRSGGVNSYTYESGTEADIKRIQSVTDPGSAGGAYSQGTAGNRPVAVRFSHGLAMYFDGNRVTSSADASAFTALHDPTSNARIALAFQPITTSVTRRILRTYNASGGGPGIAVFAGSTNRLSVGVRNDSNETVISTDTDFIIPGNTCRAILDKQGASYTWYVGGDQVATGTRSSPSINPPETTMAVGAAADSLASSFTGFLGPVAIFVGDNLPSVAALETYLSQFTLADEPDALIAMYAAEGSIAHAWPSYSMLQQFGALTRWVDVAGGADLLPADGDDPHFTTSLDNLSAVNVVGGSLENNAVAAVASGSNKPFGMMVYGTSTNSINQLFGFSSEESEEDGSHVWQLSFGEHVVMRSNDSGAFASSTPVSYSSSHRFFAHSFRGPNSAFNLKIIDGAVSSPALNVNPTTVDFFFVFGSDLTLSFIIAWNRAFNVGEYQQMWQAIQLWTS